MSSIQASVQESIVLDTVGKAGNLPKRNIRCLIKSSLGTFTNGKYNSNRRELRLVLIAAVQRHKQHTFAAMDCRTCLRSSIAWWWLASASLHCREFWRRDLQNTEDRQERTAQLLIVEDHHLNQPKLRQQWQEIKQTMQIKWGITHLLQQMNIYRDQLKSQRHHNSNWSKEEGTCTGSVRL